MIDGRPPARPVRPWVVLAVVGAVLLAGLAAPAPAARAAAGYPVLPDGTWARFVPALTGPTLDPGSSGRISVEVADPLAAALDGVTLSLQVYAFNPTTGNASEAPPTGASPLLASGGLGVNETTPSIGAGGTWNQSVPVSVPSSAPSGVFAVRLSLAFASGGTDYRLESRGFFSAAAWAAATEGPNGTPTINASKLGVSGVVPETSVLVRSPASIDWVLYGLLGASLVLAGVGAYLWSRSGPGSRSGARRGSPPQSAPRALGNSRTRDGD